MAQGRLQQVGANCGDQDAVSVVVFCDPSIVVNGEISHRKSTDLPSSNEAEWWEGDLALPKTLFKVDFVVMDKMGTGVVDNNMYVCCRQGYNLLTPATQGPGLSGHLGQRTHRERNHSSTLPAI